MTIQSATSFFWRRTKAAVAAVALVIAMLGPAGPIIRRSPIRLMLPFPAGGTVDFVARLVTARMADELGRPFVIENKAGAGGVIATDATAKAAADGYTLLLTTPNHTINAALNPKLPYDTQKDLVPVSICGRGAGIAGEPSGGAVRRLYRLRRLRQEESRQAQLCLGRQRHAAAYEHGIAAAAHRHRGRPYPLSRRGTRHDRPARRPGAAQDGHLRHRPPAVADGKLRALAYASRARSTLMPNVPTVAEMGLAGYEGILWIGIDGARGHAAADHREACGRGAARAQARDLAERLKRDGVDPAGSTPEAFGALIIRNNTQLKRVRCNNKAVG